MAKEAERLSGDTGWLPEPLRPTVDAQAVDGSADQDENGMALPDFLAGDVRTRPMPPTIRWPWSPPSDAHQRAVLSPA